MTGSAGQKRVPANFLARYEIPVPRLIEQHRVAEILDKAVAVRRKRRQALIQIDTLLRAAFLERFGDPATDPKKIGKAPLSAFGRVVTGNTPPRTEPGYFGEGIEWIKSDNINTPVSVTELFDGSSARLFDGLPASASRAL
jgi:type I restriction enzyme, S subunit